VKVPDPLPAKGAKVRVKGKYSTTFMKASSGAEADPYQGIIDYQEVAVLEPAPEVATLPRVKRKSKSKTGSGRYAPALRMRAGFLIGSPVWRPQVFVEAVSPFSA
jgi:hypothetical protein